MVEISTSILQVKKDNIINEIYELEKAKTNYFHIDAMDGEFVKNNTNTQMLEYCIYLKSVTNIPIDVHLMVADVKNYIDSYSVFRPNIITFHLETCNSNKEVIDMIRYIQDKGIRAGIAIKPWTNVEEIYEFLQYLHLVLIMTVEPGEGGQKLIPETLEKIKKLKQYAIENDIDIDIEVDGGINEFNSKKIIESGANVLVAGSAIVFSNNYKETIKKLRQEQ